MKLENLKEAIDEWYNSEKAKIYFEKISNIENIEKLQLERFYKKVSNSEINFDELVMKICQKYGSNDYCRRYMKRGEEPHESLYFFLYDFAKMYGKEVDEHEWLKYSNMFTSDMYIFENFVFQKMDGQGTCIIIDELK